MFSCEYMLKTAYDHISVLTANLLHIVPLSNPKSHKLLGHKRLKFMKCVYHSISLALEILLENAYLIGKNFVGEHFHW